MYLAKKYCATGYWDALYYYDLVVSRIPLDASSREVIHAIYGEPLVLSIKIYPASIWGRESSSRIESLLRFQKPYCHPFCARQRVPRVDQSMPVGRGKEKSWKLTDWTSL